MEFADKNQTVKNQLLLAVTNEFERGIEMISAINDQVYTTAANGTGSVGGHVRHNLDFANSFLNGIAERQIDYNRRERNPLVETDRLFAIRQNELAIKRLTNLTDEILARLVHVRSEVDSDLWLPSSILRELEFLHSHTVHHHALISEKLSGFNVAVPKNFGVARSTLKYWDQLAV